MSTRSAWLILLLAAAVSVAWYSYYRNAKLAEELAPELSSQSFKILDSTITPKPAERVIRIEGVGE